MKTGDSSRQRPRPRRRWRSSGRLFVLGQALALSSFGHASLAQEGPAHPLPRPEARRAPVFLAGKLIGDIAWYRDPDGTVRVHRNQAAALLGIDLSGEVNQARAAALEPFASLPLSGLVAHGVVADLQVRNGQPQLHLFRTFETTAPVPVPAAPVPAPTAAPATPQRPTARATLATVFLDGRIVGDLQYEIGPHGALSVSGMQVRRILALRTHRLSAPLWPADGAAVPQFIPASELASYGVTLAFDTATQALVMQIAPDAATPVSSPQEQGRETEDLTGLTQPPRSRSVEADQPSVATKAPRPPLPTDAAPSLQPPPASVERAFTATFGSVNPTGRDIAIFVPLRAGPRYFTDIELAISAEGELSVRGEDLLQALADVLSQASADFIRNASGPDGRLDLEEPIPGGLQLDYNPSALEIEVTIPVDVRQSRSISVVDLQRTSLGTFEKPAAVSGYLNVRSAIDYVHTGFETGLNAPLLDLEFVTRTGPVVFESEMLADLDDQAATTFRRRGSRLVYDDVAHANRWTLGDVRPPTSGLQASVNTLGLSLARNFSRLQPQRIIRPRGQAAFSLAEPSRVDVIVNNRVVRTLDLDAGQFNLSDFPFLVGENNVQIVAEDGTGRREAASFDLFFDRELLNPGISEYALTAGVAAPNDADGIDYQFEEPLLSGFYRRGLSTNFTLGGKLQASRDVVVVGSDAIWGTPIGTFRVDAAYSSMASGGSDYAVELDFERTLGQMGRSSRRLLLSASAFGPNFALLGDTGPLNQFAYQLSAAYAQTIDLRTTVSADMTYTRERSDRPDRYAAGVRLSRQFGRNTSLSFDASYENAGEQDGFGVLLTLNRRFGRSQIGRTSYDTASKRGLLSYSRSSQRQVDALSWNADLDFGETDAGLNADAFYLANRHEVGLAHFATYDMDGSEITNQRTSLRLAGSLAFADGSFALGRPISDSFAMVRGHDSLDGRQITVDPDPQGRGVRSGALGPALVPDLGSYSQTTLPIDVRDLPVGYNIGSGSFSLQPAYRSGFNLVVGSDFSVSAIGTVFDIFGEPVALVSGEVKPAADSTREGLRIFTNSAGRFAAQGVGPGTWVITLRTDPEVSATFVIDEDAEGFVDLGQLQAEPKS